MERAFGEMQELVRRMERAYSKEVPLEETATAQPVRNKVVAAPLVQENVVVAPVDSIPREEVGAEAIPPPKPNRRDEEVTA